jgi:hypothetical protein
MTLRSLLKPILDEDRITRGLDDAEARMLVEWMVERAERFSTQKWSQKRIRAEVHRVCQRARSIARFVGLWCHERSAIAALQLAATERFGWPLPTTVIEPCDLLGDILAWEDTPESEREPSDD